MDIPRLQLTGITKAYPGTVANDGVSLTLLPGEIHAVLGENGAGKSTLMKIIYGSVKPDAGIVVVDGMAVTIRNPQEARALGIFDKPERDPKAAREQVKVGLGAGASYFIEVGAFSGFTFFAGQIGTAETAAWAAVPPWRPLPVTPRSPCPPA